MTTPPTTPSGPAPSGPAPFATRRLDAVPLRPAYADEMAAVLADPALHAYTGGAPEDAGALRARYERQTAGSPDPAELWWNWVLRVRADGRLAGYVQATVRGTRAEVAWVVGTGWQGRGYAKEAAVGLVRHLLDQGVPAVVAHIHPEHAASAAVAAAAGLEPTEEREDGEVRWRREAPQDVPFGHDMA
ncbi:MULTISPECIES: GNAT family N-acetyltransferase [unclassified Streptomyces]|uniref:GNAT family N-acetyltransferase n=1 Tax=unclassified Streptomyces TaxID=2593676 RepID=UPI0001C18960|nr:MULTISPECIES: GNAT family N-acetyltransferase [unclassified Streptomyces]AEN11642.1 GCN5-related N-acetyltransferase [Streptomyces sp. SirexAA-E]MYR66529.1 GNAT family N-acetyltransferase [Streptomyces sp. SID4939]MYS04589.1 GNAT family N-acetyltransferase [Streptomyces sp. SID4940]MYT61835.1 GNAT family N-acetyltransferase [Streptomyces sp. SID8357]MYT85205.1 GNAT family N-acetyltransferase [Streptomyces sp. SID8360]